MGIKILVIVVMWCALLSPFAFALYELESALGSALKGAGL
jgi:hypothetical protein